MSDALSRLQDLDEKELDALIDVAQARASGGLSRRELLQGAGAVAGGSILGGSLVGSASADASTSDGDPNVGTPSTPVDVFAEGIEATSLDTDRLNKTRVVDPTESVQSAIDAAEDSFLPLSGTVRLTPGEDNGDEFDFTPDSLPIVVRPGVTVDIRDTTLRPENDAAALFELRDGSAVIGHNAFLQAGGGGRSFSGSIFQIDSSNGNITTSEGVAIYGYPEVSLTSTGSHTLEMLQPSGGNISGVYAEIHIRGDSGPGHIDVNSSGGGYINRNEINVKGRIDEGRLVYLHGGGTINSNQIRVNGALQVRSNVSEVVRFEGSETQKNLVEGSFADPGNAADPWVWGSNCGPDNQVVGATSEIPSGTNNSGKENNVAVSSPARTSRLAQSVTEFVGDDSVASFDVTGIYGIDAFPDSGSTAGKFVSSFDTLVTAAVDSQATNQGGGTTLFGTTGPDGTVNYARDGNTLYVENRLGSGVTVRLNFELRAQ